jgi:hypothetical protein
MTPYDLLICEFKSAAQLAKLLKLSPSTVQKWKTNPIPLKHLNTIYYLSKLSRQSLRPDKFKKD